MLSPFFVITLPRSFSDQSSPLKYSAASTRPVRRRVPARSWAGADPRLPLNAEDHVLAAAAVAPELRPGLTAAAGVSQWSRIALSGQAPGAHGRRAGTERWQLGCAGRARGAGLQDGAGRTA